MGVDVGLGACVEEFLSEHAWIARLRFVRCGLVEGDAEAICERDMISSAAAARSASKGEGVGEEPALATAGAPLAR